MMDGFVSSGRIDVTDLARYLPFLEPLFDIDCWRQKMPMSPHANSESIILRGPPSSRPRDILHSLDILGSQALGIGEVFEPLYRARMLIGYPLARVMIVRLPPGGYVVPHVDEGRYAAATERWHLPIHTNGRAWIEVDGDRRHLDEGVLMWIDKHRMHSAGNDGDTPRVHLIVDAWVRFPEDAA